MNYLTAISNFGDLAATTPIMLGVACFFVIQGNSYFAIRWISLNVVGMGLVVASKIAFIGWGIGISAIDYTGCSGHAMRASAVFPVVAFLIFRKSSPPIQVIAGISCLGISVMIGFSRFFLHLHSISEIIMGCLFGFMISAYFIAKLKHSVPTISLGSLVMICTIPFVSVTILGPTQTQAVLVDMALYLSGHAKPYVREEWSL